MDIALVDYEATCAAGTGLTAIRGAIAAERSGLQESKCERTGLNTWLGSVPEINDYRWEKNQSPWESRNNALINIGLYQGSFPSSVERLKRRLGTDRIGVVIGSSTSSIDRSEEAYANLENDSALADEYRQSAVLNPHAPGLYLEHLLGCSGPTLTINTACSSSAKVFATAKRWLSLHIVDAVIVAGADTLGKSVLYGFHSLQLISTQPCRPFDVNRDGINLGEGAGFAILARADEVDEHTGIILSGYGESSDAHHMSHPHPTGEGARIAINQALALAKLNAKDIDYVNLHGTASRANDLIEGNVVGGLFDESVLASSTKGWTGHTLGAAGILEAIFAVEALRFGTVPGTLNMQRLDPEINIRMVANNRYKTINHAMTNSFGFGGNNACLIFSKHC
ncbi:beta-ketoacyl-ACP synthase [Halioglobus sp.]|nr:beta-ketoacyl-ACP synthase [Halioglobus sp.]